MTARSILALAVALLLTAACAPADDGGLHPPDVERTWAEFRETPTDDTYLRFLHANRLAAMQHGNPGDAAGVLHQVRALEAQADQARRAGDLNLADAVVMRVLEIEQAEMLGVYDEALPGARERLLAARASVEGMLR